MLGDDEEEEHATVSVTANGEDDTDSLEWCIREMLKDEFGHVQPRPFQISAIATLVPLRPDKPEPVTGPEDRTWQKPGPTRGADDAGWSCHRGGAVPCHRHRASQFFDVRV